MKRKDGKQSIAVKTSDQTEEKVGTNELKIFTFSRFLKTGKMSSSR